MVDDNIIFQVIKLPYWLIQRLRALDPALGALATPVADLKRTTQEIPRGLSKLEWKWLKTHKT